MGDAAPVEALPSLPAVTCSDLVLETAEQMGVEEAYHKGAGGAAPPRLYAPSYPATAAAAPDPTPWSRASLRCLPSPPERGFNLNETYLHEIMATLLFR